MNLLLVAAAIVVAFVFGYLAGCMYVWNRLKSAIRSLLDEGVIEWRRP